MFGPGANSRHRLVECDQLQSTHTRKIQQRGVRHSPVADNFWYQCIEWGCRERWCCRCILMMRMSNETVQQMYRSLAIDGYADYLRI